MGRQSNRRRRRDDDDDDTDEAARAAVAEAEVEARRQRRRKRVLLSPVPLHVIVGTDGDGDDDGLCLSLVQTLIDRRVKLVADSRRRAARKGMGTAPKLNRKDKSTLSFVVFSNSPSAESIGLDRGKDETKRVLVKSLGENWRDDLGSGASAHLSFLQHTAEIVAEQLNGKIAPRLHGIFVHLCVKKKDARCRELRALLQSMFMEEHEIGIRRLDVQGVVVVVQPEILLEEYPVLFALADRFVVASPPPPAVLDDSAEAEFSGSDLVKILRHRYNRAEAVEGRAVRAKGTTSDSSRLLVLDDSAVGTVDEIFAFSRFVVTQVFPYDDDMRRARPLLAHQVASSRGDHNSGLPRVYTALVVLPSGTSVDLNKFQFWLENYFLTANGANILRIKGLLSVRGSRKKFVLQGTGVSYGMEETAEVWWNQSRKCTLFFMSTAPLDGGNIQKALLQTRADEGWFEMFYWWVDSHCCLMALGVLLFSTLSLMGVVGAMDFGLIPSIL
jgi:G3E family GTPase